jgi:asparagine synthase (glutamine-hydrolysing)
MRECMAHRGPDDAGIYVSPDQRVVLTNRHLAVRDLSAAGHMPMVNENGDVCITYNGELYSAEERAHGECQRE